MLPLRRTALTLSRRATTSPVTRRAFTPAAIRLSDDSHENIKPQVPAGAQTGRNMDKLLEDVEKPSDLLPEGANPGTVPTDLEQATGLERLEILGKMQGIDVFDMKPLPGDRLGTLEEPVMVKSAGDEQYCGCRGIPAGSHRKIWIVLSRKRPLGRCTECGSCYMMEYIGPPDDPHDDHHHHGYEEPKTIADYVRPEYFYGSPHAHYKT
ncbi:MAG: Cytochrome c oxidase subunit 4 [Alyxoria varia]|nr:MAG: Cytochrome c oxidase subunit 4 [Alyxoria varia]